MGARKRAPRSAAAKASTAAASQMTANRTSRQIIPTKKREREQRRRKPEPDRAPRRSERQRAEGEPIQRGREQEHARRAGRDRIDEPPEHRHRRRLPIAEAPSHGVGILGGAAYRRSFGEQRAFPISFRGS